MRIAIVNDMKLACEALRRAVSGGGHAVAWIAEGGQAAIDRAAADRPDLILMDMIMPQIDGVEATRRIMQQSPCPILVVTSTVSGNISKVYEAMGHGAIDAVETPQLGPNGELEGAEPLLGKIKRIERMLRPAPRREPQAAGSSVHSLASGQTHQPRLVLIGASTGGPKVITQILSALPADLPAAVLLAQHVDEAYATGLAQWLGTRSRLPVELAKAGVAPLPGRAYLAAAKAHLVLSADGLMRYSTDPPGWYRPSVNSLFQSAARHWPHTGVAVLLTGMGEDGAEGLAALKKRGWATIAQDRASSVVWGMPKAAVELQAAQHVLHADDIARAVADALTAKLTTSTTRTP